MPEFDEDLDGVKVIHARLADDDRDIDGAICIKLDFEEGSIQFGISVKNSMFSFSEPEFFVSPKMSFTDFYMFLESAKKSDSRGVVFDLHKCNLEGATNFESN